jgi:hypothetical protein
MGKTGLRTRIFSAGGGGRQASTSFSEEKEAKRLLFIGAFGADHRRSRRSKSFLLLFLKKKCFL